MRTSFLHFELWVHHGTGHLPFILHGLLQMGGRHQLRGVQLVHGGGRDALLVEGVVCYIAGGGWEVVDGDFQGLHGRQLQRSWDSSIGVHVFVRDHLARCIRRDDDARTRYLI